MLANPSILIVGAGPVGLTAALELARRGFRSRIIDRADAPTPVGESRALGIHDRTLRLLEPSGVMQKLLAAGNRVDRGQVRRRGRVVLEIDLTILGNPHPYILVLPQGATERILIEALAEHGIEVERKTECIGVQISDTGALATLRGTNGETVVNTDYLLGADGHRSLVREAAGIRFHGGETEQQTFRLLDTVTSEPIDPRVAVFDFLPDGAIARIPINQNLVRYVSNRPDIGSVVPQTEPIADIVWQSDFRISYRHVETYRKGPAFLMGDAAHIHSPAGGRGMNLGMEDAAWFAWALTEGRLDRYSEDRLPYAIRTLKFSRTQTGQITGATRFRNAIMATVAPWLWRLPPLRRLAVRNILALDTPLPPWLK